MLESTKLRNRIGKSCDQSASNEEDGVKRRKEEEE